MDTVYLVITLVLAALVAFSGLGKLRRDPRIVRIIHEVIGVPLKYFPHLAAGEFAGALGLVLGIWWPSLGVAAGIVLVLYFGRDCVACACGRCERDGTCRLHADRLRRSTRPADLDSQAG